MIFVLIMQCLTGNNKMLGSFVVYLSMGDTIHKSSPVSWSCIIHGLHLYRGVRPPNKCPGYDIIPSDGEASVTLKLWGMQSTLPLPSLPGPPWPGVVGPDRVLSMDQIELFEFDHLVVCEQTTDV